MTPMQFWRLKRKYAAEVIFGPGRSHLTGEELASVKRHYILALDALERSGAL